MCAIVLYPTVKLLARRVIKGPKLPRHGGALLVMNHVSHLDPVFDAILVHNNDRVPRFMAKASLWKVPVLGKVLVGAGQVPVYRGGDARESLRAAKESLEVANKGLEQGKLLVIYPEGTITKDPDGWPMAPRTGVARLALASDVPVIPAARWGTREIYDGYSKKFRPFPRKTVTSVLGEPVDLSAYRIVQEALTNTLKHAGSAHAEVVVRYGASAVELEIADDGRGAPTNANGSGHGLIGMRERTALYGGLLDAGPRAGGGYAVHARLPLRGGATR